jgi:hypothetical protein
VIKISHPFNYFHLNTILSKVERGQAHDVSHLLVKGEPYQKSARSKLTDLPGPIFAEDGRKLLFQFSQGYVTSDDLHHSTISQIKPPGCVSFRQIYMVKPKTPTSAAHKRSHRRRFFPECALCHIVSRHRTNEANLRLRANSYEMPRFPVVVACHRYVSGVNL